MVTGVNPTVNGSGETYGETARNVSGADALGRSEFLRLLITQLQEQDPLNPMESTEFTAQLAQFSSLEKLTDIGERLTEMKTGQTDMLSGQAVGWIGKTVKAEGNAFFLSENKEGEISFSLEGDAATTSVHLYDASGNYVDTLEIKGLGAGEHTMVWDGKDSNNMSMPPGTYFFDIAAVDENDDLISATSFFSETVGGVDFSNGTPLLLAGDRRIPIDAVLEVREPSAGLKNDDFSFPDIL